MKRILMLSVVAMFIASASAQEFVAKKRSGGGFNVEAPGVNETQEFLEIDGESFVVWETAKGAKFVKCLSPRTGNLYPVWVGEKTEHEYDGRIVYRMKSGTYCVYKVSMKTGNPYPVYLDTK